MLIVALALMAIGATLIALPDSGRLITFSSDHGPGVLDALGALLLTVGAGLIWWKIWRGRASIGKAPLLAFTGGLGAGLTIASVLNDFGWWWAIGAGLLTVTQFALYFKASRATG
jgi:hypothetical protein